MLLKQTIQERLILFVFCFVLLAGVNPVLAEDTDCFSFAVIGDIHYKGGTDSPKDKWPEWYAWLFPQMLKELASLENPPAFVVVVGDLVDGYSGSAMNCPVERYEPQYKQLLPVIDKHLGNKIGFAAAVGNHDYHRYVLQGKSGKLIHAGPQQWAKHILPRVSVEAQPENSSYYSFDYGNSHFIILCTGLLGSKKVNDFNSLVYGQQYNWLVKDITKAAADPNTKNIFAFGHHPFYPLTNNFDSFERQIVLQNRIWKPLFARYGVKAYFHGHDHFYDRSSHEGVAMIDVGGGSVLEDPGYEELRINHYALVEVKRKNVTVNIHALQAGVTSKIYESYDLSELMANKLQPSYEALKASYKGLFASGITGLPRSPYDLDEDTILLRHFDTAEQILSKADSIESDCKLVQGKFSKAYRFGGKDESYLKINVKAMPGCDGLLSMWVNFDHMKTDQVLLNTQYKDMGLNLGLIVREQKPYIRLCLYDNNIRQRIRGSVQDWSPGQWHHIQISWDCQRQIMRLFLEGVFIAKENLSFEPDFGTAPTVWIGADANGGEKFAGAMDELLIKK